MIETVKAVTAGDAAHILRAKLGAKRNWSDFLADCIRNRANYNGFRLLPVTRRKDKLGKRPVYAVGDITQFIADVKASDPSAGPDRVKSFMVEIETDHAWFVRRADQAGRIIKHKFSIQRAKNTTH